MAVISITVPITIPADPNQALTEALCGTYLYQIMIPTVSGLMPNPQSSGDFANLQISGYFGRIINNYYQQVASITAKAAAGSGVNQVISTATTGTPFMA